ncbi:MAG: prepilin-type N-terminal cleavage/methylation domain-containing protein [candidate division Zixibacteria bacterium]|nr:prepilin-type N-terminal cleavage/methylation domain-containing protein [candidate division Zixibacteria bacterium]
MVRVKNQKGITLVELLIACLLTFIVGSAALEFYSSQHNQWLAQTDVSEMQQNARALKDELTTSIRSAGYGIIVGHPRMVVTSNTLTIYRKDSTKIDTIQYYLSTANPDHPSLVKQINQDTPQVFAEDIESVQFSRSGNLITITLVAREGRRDPEYAGDGYRRRTLIVSAEVRNKM